MSGNFEKQWDEYGDNDPYYAVATFDKFYSTNLNDELLNEFFETGEEYTERIWGTIERHFCSDFRPERSLDFGCGVGRLLIPIAKRSGRAVGVDISNRMLELARSNAAKFDITNIDCVKSDPELSQLHGNFDFVHSFVVMQHIDPVLGEALVTRMIDHLDDGGIGALHLTYKHSVNSPTLWYRLYRLFPIAYRLRTFLFRQKMEPLIPIYSYDLNRIFEILQTHNCNECLVRFSDHGIRGVHIFFRKRTDFIY